MNRIYLLLFSGVLLFSCTQNTEKETNNITPTTNLQNDLLSNEVTIKNYINIINNENQDWVASANGAELFNTIIDIAKTKVDVYDTDSDTTKLSEESILRNMGKNIQITEVEITDGVFKTDTIVIAPELKEIQGLFFNETWSFDAEKFNFSKNITKYSLVREYYKTTVEGAIDSSKRVKQIIFDVKNTNSENYASIGKNVTYPFYFNAETPNSITGINVTKFAQYLINYAFIDKKEVFDFYDQNTTLNFDEIREKLGATCETYEIEKDGAVITDSLCYDPIVSEITGVIFVEDWFLDKETLSFKKEIIGIAPIRAYMFVTDGGDSIERNTIPYLIKL